MILETDRRILGESIPRIRKCLARLTLEQVWARPRPEMASIGNLVLHVVGNARQWILHALVGQPDIRDRDTEFSTTGPLPVHELGLLLDQLEKDLRSALPAITEAQLLATYPVQVFEESGASILIHAIEHFSYHTGQIARDTKHILGGDLGFYAHLSL